MMATIKAEFRKLLTVRTTYGLILLGLAINGLFSFLASYKGDAAALAHHDFIVGNVTTGVSFSAFSAGIIAVLLLANEYRHNTIMYTLTSSNSRSKVLVAKIFVTLVFAVLFTVLMTAASLLITKLGLQLNHHTLISQTIPYADLWWRLLFFGCGYALIGLLFVTLMRNQIISIIGLFVIPATLEGVLSMLLKHNSIYLPFSALGETLAPPENGAITATKAALVFLIYMVVGWIVAWTLFVKRDAN